MKARKKNSSDEWKEIKYVQLENSDILYKQEYLEFDTLSTELKTNSQIANEAHWRGFRERAAIAAMHAIINGDFEDSEDPKGVAEGAIEYADALINALKGIDK